VIDEQARACFVRLDDGRDAFYPYGLGTRGFIVSDPEVVPELVTFIVAGLLWLISWFARIRFWTRSLERTTERLSVRTWARTVADVYTTARLRILAGLSLIVAGFFAALALGHLIMAGRALDVVFGTAMTIVGGTGCVLWWIALRAAHAAPRRR
jgi:hypothetical protein